MSGVLTDIFELYDREGYNTYGEGINQIEHGVQCAELAKRQGASDEMVTAALLHDIGHLLAATDIAYGNYKHDAVGADYLAHHFNDSVSEPVRLHAQAKRYLCTVEEGYLQSLSEASLDSLHHQGGLMSDDEAQAFLQRPFADQAIQLRRWDDEGKVEELSSGSVRDYRDQVEAALNEKRAG